MIRKLHSGLLLILLSTGIHAQVFNTDVIVQGSMQIGANAQNGYSFGFDTFVMSEDNLRMLFDDTSASASFPGNDWRFTFNDSSNGGSNYFSIDDVTGGKTPFRIDAGAPNNAFRIGSNGNIGIGTNNPGDFELHISDGDTPSVRLAQSGGGYGDQTWDVAGNEANFFIRDATNGSKIPFRIQPNTPKNTLTLRSSGTVGVGTWGPNSNASIHMSANNKGLLINRMTTEQRTDFAVSLGTGENGMMVYDTEENKLYLWNGAEWITDSDAQDLGLTDNTLSLTNDATTVDLSKYLDNTDNQTIDIFQLDGNNLELSLERDDTAAQTVDLSGYLDNTDAQDLDLSDNTLSLTNDGTTVDLSAYLDNTDAQDLDLSGNTLSLTNDGTTVDLSAYLDNTDRQTLILDNTNLTISGGNSIDLSGLQDGIGTDHQTLNLDSDVLRISNGNTVDLSSYVNTDHQNLTGATLSGTDLTIEIQNGNSVSVNLEPIVADIETDLINAQQEIADLVSQNQAQQTIIEELIDRIEALEQNTVGIENPTNKNNVPILYQNIPNPFNGTSTIKYFLPDGITNASIVFSNTFGQVFSTVAIQKSGDGELNVNSDGLATGTYFYTLFVGSQKIDSKKMVIQ